jgi:hypothetical protein
MCDRKDGRDFEATVRRAFARLTCEDLPRAAETRGWPIQTPAEFERLLLAHLGSSPAKTGFLRQSWLPAIWEKARPSGLASGTRMMLRLSIIARTFGAGRLTGPNVFVPSV